MMKVTFTTNLTKPIGKIVPLYLLKSFKRKGSRGVLVKETLKSYSMLNEENIECCRNTYYRLTSKSPFAGEISFNEED